MPTTASSRILEGYYPHATTAIERLEAAGAVVIGKTNCDEFAMGSSTENSAYGITRNPWNGERILVDPAAARPLPWRRGWCRSRSDRIRADQSASRPRCAESSGSSRRRTGLEVWPARVRVLAGSDRAIRNVVEDAALAFDVMAGHDPRLDCSAAPVPEYSNAVMGSSLKGVRIGVPRHLIEEGVEAAVLEAVNKALTTLEQAGATIVDVTPPHSRHGIAAYYLIATAEASSNLARRRRALRRARAWRHPPSRRCKTRGAGFGAEVERHIMLGTYVLSAGYYDAHFIEGRSRCAR